MNDTATRPPTAKQIEDAAAEIHRHVHRAADLASAGNYRKAHAEAERAQGAARRLKELLGAAATQPDETATSKNSAPNPRGAAERKSSRPPTPPPPAPPRRPPSGLPPTPYAPPATR